MSSLDGQTMRGGLEARFARAERHSRRVRLLRIAVPAAVVLALVAIAGASVFNPFRLLGKLPLGIDNLTVSGTKITMASPHLTGFTPDQRAYDLRAKTATQDVTDPVHMELHDLTSNVQMEDKSTVMMEGENGLFNTKTQLLELRDRIFLRTTTGYEARLTQATVDMAKGTVDSHRPVAVKLLNGTLDSNGLHIVDNGALIVFDGGVTMLLDNMGDNTPKPAETAAKPAETTARSARPAEAGVRPTATTRK